MSGQDDGGRKPPANPRENADDAFEAFMSMGQAEWLGLCMSVAAGGCLQPQEQIGFYRALATRKAQQQQQQPDKPKELATTGPRLARLTCNFCNHADTYTVVVGRSLQFCTQCGSNNLTDAYGDFCGPVQR